MTELLTPEIVSGLKRIIRHFDREQKKELRETWVKIGVIKEKTIWKSKEQMRTARDNGYVQYKRKDNGIWYNLSSVHEQFLKK